MAAGLGSRYGGLKQLDGIGPSGELIIEYSIYDAIKAGFDRVVFLIKPEHESDFEERLACKIRDRIKVDYAFQVVGDLVDKYPNLKDRTKPLGTGHAILCGREVVGDDDFAVINADDFYSADAFIKIAEFLNNNSCHCMAGYLLENTVSENGTVSRGVCTKDADDNLVNIVEHEKIDSSFKNNAEPFVDLSPDTIVSMNAWGFKSSMFDVFEQEFYKFLDKNIADLSKCEYYLSYPTQQLADKENIKVLNTTAKWYGVTYREDKEHVTNAITELIKQNVYPERLWN